MKDPIPLSDDAAEATDFERSLLQMAQEERLPGDARLEIWAGIAKQCLPAVAVLPAAKLSATHWGVQLAPWTKGLILLAGLSGLGTGGYLLLKKAPITAPPAAVVAQAPAAVVTPSSAEPVAPEAPAVAQVGTEDAPHPAAREATPASSHDVASRETTLRDESLAVLEARRTLRSGDAAQALRLLDQARQRFPKGALGQEREALTIEALAKSGNAASAKRRAQAFLHAYPKSPYAADLQSIANP